MPDLTGLSYPEAKTKLKELGLTDTTDEKEDGSSPWIIIEENWVVVSHDPAPGAKVTKTTKVTLIVKNVRDFEEEAPKEENPQPSAVEAGETQATQPSSLEKVEEHMVLTVDKTNSDYNCVIATIPNSNAFFKYYTSISNDAEEYMTASGIRRGTLVYEKPDEFIKYILKGSNLLVDTQSMVYLYNKNHVPEEDIMNDINAILTDRGLTLSDLRNAMQEKYDLEQ